MSYVRASHAQDTNDTIWRHKETEKDTEAE